MLPIFETKNFMVGTLLKPQHSRSNGGQIVIFPKTEVEQHYELSLDIARDFMYLSMIVGEAATTIMRRNGLVVVRGNYQENGNWAHKPGAEFPPRPHLHIFLRTTDESHPNNDSRFQAFPEAIFMPAKESGYYDSFEPLTEKDCQDIHDEILKLLSSEKYQSVDIEEL